MKAKEYLSQIRTMKATLNACRERIEALYHEASGVKAIVYDKDRVQVSPSNKLEELMAKIDEEAEKWTRLRAKYDREVRRRTDMINRMPNATHAEILRLRYLDSDRDGRTLTFEAIAVKMGYSYNRVKHLHGEALEMFRRRYLKS